MTDLPVLIVDHWRQILLAAAAIDLILYGTAAAVIIHSRRRHRPAAAGQGQGHPQPSTVGRRGADAPQSPPPHPEFPTERNHT